jgi:metallophosphoesterase superfamily enzyme
MQKLLSIREKGLFEALGAEKVAALFERLRKYLGCIDEGLVIPNMHKIGIAGVGAGSNEREIDQIALYVREHPELRREIEAIVWHEHCAARESDDDAAERGAREFLRKIGLPESVLQSGGFSNETKVKMQRDVHLHPATSFVVDGTDFRCNGHRLGVPVFEIAARGVPMSYVNRQVALMGKKIIGGQSGMASVMANGDPIVGFIAHESPTEALHLEHEIKDSLKEFPKKPEIVHLIVPEQQ